MTGLYVVATLVFCYAVLREVIRDREEKAQCTRCRNLIRKGGRGWRWKYECMRYDGFDKPPEYCGKFEPREDRK